MLHTYHMKELNIVFNVGIVQHIPSWGTKGCLFLANTLFHYNESLVILSNIRAFLSYELQGVEIHVQCCAGPFLTLPCHCSSCTELTMGALHGAVQHFVNWRTWTINETRWSRKNLSYREVKQKDDVSGFAWPKGNTWLSYAKNVDSLSICVSDTLKKKKSSPKFGIFSSAQWTDIGNYRRRTNTHTFL